MISTQNKTLWMVLALLTMFTLSNASSRSRSPQHHRGHDGKGKGKAYRKERNKQFQYEWNNVSEVSQNGTRSTAGSKRTRLPVESESPVDAPAPWYLSPAEWKALLTNYENIASTPRSNQAFNEIVSAELATDPGMTLNLNGTTYENGGLIVPIDSKNIPQEDLSREEVARFVREHANKLGGIVKVGLYKFENKPEVSIDLNIVVPPEYRELAIEYGRQAGQKSLFDLKTFLPVETGEDGSNPFEPSTPQFKDIIEQLTQGKLPLISSPRNVPNRFCMETC